MCRAVCWSCVRCSSAMPERAPRRRERYDPSTGDRMEFVRAMRVAVVGFPWGEMYPPCTDTYLCASVQHGSGRMAPPLAPLQPLRLVRFWQRVQCAVEGGRQ